MRALCSVNLLFDGCARASRSLDVSVVPSLSFAAVGERETAEQVTRSAGRGFASILAAKLYFLVAGYAIVVSLSWILGRALYGVYGLVVGAISVLDNVIVTGTIQAVSRYTAADEEQAGAIKAAALKLQVLLGGGVAVLFAFGAPWIARFERDESLTPYLRLAAGIVLCYAFYSVFIGSANGLRRFGIQAALDALYATIRGLLIVGLAAAGYAVWGAVGGFVAASCVIVVVAASVIGVRDLRAGFPVWTLARFVGPVMLYLLLVNLAMFADLFLLKRLSTELVQPGVEGAEVVNATIGSYVAVQQLARITYQALISVTFVVFPLVSRSSFQADQESTRSYVETTMRYSFILAAGIAVSFVALPAQVLRVPFPVEYQVGADALALLAPGYVAFSLFIVGTTILNAAGRLRLALTATGAMLAAVAAICWLLIPTTASPSGALVTAAAGATAGMVLGWIIVSAVLRRHFGATTPKLTTLRVLLAASVAVAIGRLLPHSSRVVTLAECLLVVGCFFLVLVVTRELGRRDWERVARVVQRQGK